MLKKKVRERELAFAILTGGKSTRFGSDKGLYEFLGKSLIVHEFETIQSVSAEIFVVSRSQSQTEAYKLKMGNAPNISYIIDDTELFKEKNNAPMIGFYSTFKILSNLNYKHVFMLSCDVPFIQRKVIDLLIQESKGYDCCIPRWNNGYLEPLCAIYPVEKGLQKAKSCLVAKTFKLSKLIEDQWKINYVSIEDTIQRVDKDLLTFSNINSLKDLEKIKK